MRLFSLKDEIAFVTGAGSGIGQGIAIGLAEAGADVALFDMPASEGLEDTERAVKEKGRRALIVTGDVVDGASLTAAVEKTEQALGPLTLAVNCAGIANAAPAEDMPFEQWKRDDGRQPDGRVPVLSGGGTGDAGRKRGAIVNIASMSGSIVNRGLTQAHYNASKAGVIHLSKSLAMEWVDRGVRVNVISPGYTLTPMNKRPEVAEQLKVFAAETPMARIATVEEMVGPAIFLLSPAASFMTGVDLLVDGGFECW